MKHVVTYDMVRVGKRQVTFQVGVDGVQSIYRYAPSKTLWFLCPMGHRNTLTPDKFLLWLFLKNQERRSGGEPW